MLIALRPSTGDFPSNADMLLAEALIESGLARSVFELDRQALVYYEGVFLTDIIKCRGPAKEEVKSLPESCKAYLRRELQIVCPDRIIAMGGQTRDIIWDIRNELGLHNKFPTVEHIPTVWHYTYAFRMRKIKGYKDRFLDILAKLSLP